MYLYQLQAPMNFFEGMIELNENKDRHDACIYQFVINAFNLVYENCEHCDFDSSNVYLSVLPDELGTKKILTIRIDNNGLAFIVSEIKLNDRYYEEIEIKTNDRHLNFMRMFFEYTS